MDDAKIHDSNVTSPGRALVRCAPYDKYGAGLREGEPGPCPQSLGRGEGAN